MIFPNKTVYFNLDNFIMVKKSSEKFSKSYFVRYTLIWPGFQGLQFEEQIQYFKKLKFRSIMNS